MKFEADLTERLRAAADRVPAGDPPMEGIVHRGRRRRVARAIAVVAALSVLAALLPAGLIGLSRIGHGPTTPANHSVVRIDVGGRAIRRPIVAYGAFWSIVEKQRGPLALVRIDARTLRATTLKLAGTPESVAAGFESIWVACADGAVRKLDPSTGAATASFPMLSPIGGGHDVARNLHLLWITAGEGAVWVATYTGVRSDIVGGAPIFRIDPTTGLISTPAQVGPSINDMVAGEGALWLLAGDRLVQVDRSTGQLNTLQTRGVSLATGEGAVWVNTGGLPGSIVRVDPRTNRTVGTIQGSTLGRPAVADGYVWFGTTPISATRIEIRRVDPRTNAIDPRSLSLRAGRPRIVVDGEFLGMPVDVAVGEGAVWATDEHAFQVIRIDLRSFAPHPSPSPRTLAITRIDLGGIPIRQPVATQGALWTIVEAQPGETTSLVRVDAREGALTRLLVGADPEYLAVGFGVVWVAGCPHLKPSLDCPDGTVYRIDSSTGRITGRVRVGGNLLAIAAGAGAIWVGQHTYVDNVTEPGFLFRVDPDSLALRRYSLEALRGKRPPCCIQALAATDKAVWPIYEGRVIRVDPTTGAFTKLDAYGSGVVAGEGAVWVEGRTSPVESSSVEHVLRIDPATDQITETGSSGVNVIAGNGEVWANQTSLPFTNRTVTLQRLDPATTQPNGPPISFKAGPAKVSFEGVPFLGAFVHAAYADGVLWVTVGDSFEAIRIAPE